MAYKDVSMKAVYNAQHDPKLVYDSIDTTPMPLPPLKRGYSETLEQTVMRILRASGAYPGPGVVDEDDEGDEWLEDDDYDDLDDGFDSKLTSYEASEATTGASDKDSNPPADSPLKTTNPDTTDLVDTQGNAQSNLNESEVKKDVSKD